MEDQWRSDKIPRVGKSSDGGYGDERGYSEYFVATTLRGVAKGSTQQMVRTHA